MATATATSLSKLESILGNDAASLLQHECKTIPKSQLHLPGPDFITRIFATSDRPTRVLRSLETAEALEDPQARAPFLTFVFVGAGAPPVLAVGSLIYRDKSRAEDGRERLRQDIENHWKEGRLVITPTVTESPPAYPASPR